MQVDDPWWDFELSQGVAVAWNPSLAGGAKDEDTFLLGADGVEQITRSADWPTAAETSSRCRRPAVLVTAG